MSLYQKRFKKFLSEQDDENTELTDQEAMASTLDPETSPDEFDVDVPEAGGDSPINTQSKQMFDELNSWITEFDRFSEYLNGTADSIQTSLNAAEPDTIFDSISNAETKKIARVAMEISSLSEIFKGYLAGANDPKYKFN
jgi:hypothetical protein